MTAAKSLARWSIAVRGTVQGVGFRPFVFNLATNYGLAGWVQYRCGQLTIEVEGETSILSRFTEDLLKNPPPAAQIATLERSDRAPNGEAGFRIQPSAADGSGPALASDAAICAACAAELFNPRERRAGYALLSCGTCGPRLSI